MLSIRHAEDRGLANFGWLNSRHTFSFGQYYDPHFMGYGSLRVINDDRVQPGSGFDTHGHQDMEIISYVLEGALEHRDSMGHGSIIRPGDVQRMSAGTGVRHSEFNPSDADPVHFLQIWILPEQKGLVPSYEEKTFPDANKRGRLCLIGSHDGREGSVTIHQDLDLYATLLANSETVSYELAADRKAWLHIARGEAVINEQSLKAGDGVAIEGPNTLHLVGAPNAELLLFDMR